MCTKLRRYLMRLGYIGSDFSGMQKIVSVDRIPENTSIQAKIESALSVLSTSVPPVVVLSSRTDSGVHALNTSIHIDLVTGPCKVYPPQVITKTCNQSFLDNNLSIIAKNTIRVPLTFHARFSAKSRSYLYRLAVLRTKDKYDSTFSALPIEEYKRCFLIHDPSFDTEKFISGTKLFEGYHDFETFKKRSSKYGFQKLNHRRLIISMTASRGQSFCVHGGNPDIEFINVYVKGKGFLHNQVRRMIGCLCSLARGYIEPQDIITMLQVPSRHSWLSGLCMAEPSGLYLYDVEYDPDDLILDAEEDN